MLERLGRGRILMPLVALLVAGFVMTMVVYPMVTAKPKDMPLGVVSLDEGVKTPQGIMDAGEQLSGRLVDAGAQNGAEDDGEPAATWTRFTSQEDLDRALDAHELYAAIVIPENFTTSQIEARTTGGDVQPLKVLIDTGKNPTAAAAVESTIKDLVAQAGLHAQIEHLNTVDLGGGSLNLAVQFTVLPTFVLTLACSVSLFVATRLKRGTSRTDRLRTVGIQAGAAVILSGCIGVGVSGILAGIAGLAIPFGKTALFVWLASFCLMLLFVGCLDAALPLGIAVILLCFACGLTTANLPYEFLPVFWQVWIYPWVPQHWIADGVRSIYYLGKDVANTACGALLAYGATGLAALATSVIVSKGRKKMPCE